MIAASCARLAERSLAMIPADGLADEPARGYGTSVSQHPDTVSVRLLTPRSRRCRLRAGRRSRLTVLSQRAWSFAANTGPGPAALSAVQSGEHPRSLLTNEISLWCPVPDTSPVDIESGPFG
jgi:hypothetical protein